MYTKFVTNEKNKNISRDRFDFFVPSLNAVIIATILFTKFVFRGYSLSMKYELVDLYNEAACFCFYHYSDYLTKQRI